MIPSYASGRKHFVLDGDQFLSNGEAKRCKDPWESPQAEVALRMFSVETNDLA
jgi:hypothetical protein